MTLVACSKAEERAELSFRLPDWEALRNADVARRSKVSSLAMDTARIHAVILTVTGEGMRPVEWKWDRGNNATATPPSRVDLAATKGPQRHVQLLALYAGDMGMEFYYANAKKDFAADNEAVELTPKNVATELKLVEGKIIGRFLTHKVNDVPVGPTMKFQYRFFPPNTTDSMVITTGEMFSGWVDLTSFNSSIIGYTDMGGNPLPGFDKNFSFQSDKLYGVGAESVRSMRFHVPAGWENQSHQNGQYEMHPSGMKKVVLGFFGPESGGKRVCYQTPNPEDAVENLYVDQAHTNPIEWWNESGGFSEGEKAFVETTPVKGGLKTNNCGAAAGEFINYLVFNHKKAGRHSDDMVGFKGPFQKVSSDNSGYNQFATVTYDGSSSLTVTWKYLPGVKAALRGATVFWREVATNDVWNHTDDIREIMGDGYLCNLIAKEPATYGFSSQGVSQSDETTTISGITDSTKAQKTQILICPKGQDFQGNEIHFNYGQMASYHSGGGSNAEIRITGPMNSNISTNACVELTATYYVNGQVTPAPTPATIQLSSNDSSADWFPGSNTLCDDSTPLPGGPDPELVLPSGQSSVTFRYNASTAQGLHDIGGNVSGLPVWVRGHRMAFYTASPPSQMTIAIDNDENTNPLRFVAGQCYGMEVRLEGSVSYLKNDTARSYTLGTSGQFYTSQDCSTGLVSNLNFTSAEAYKQLYFKAPAATASGTVAIGGTSPGAQRTFSSDAPTLHHFKLIEWNSPLQTYEDNDCVQAKVGAFTVNGAQIRPQSPISVTLTGSNVQFATQANCSDATSSRSVDIEQWGSDDVYVKFGTTASASASAVGAGVTSNLSFYHLPDELRITSEPNAGPRPNCALVRIKPYLAGSPISAPVNLSLNIGGNNLNIYNENTCSTMAGATTETILAGQTQKDFYVNEVTDGATAQFGFMGFTAADDTYTADVYGFLVATSNLHSANLSGIAGATTACTTNLTAQAFLGKSNANLSNVRAFICDNSTCNNLQLNTRYKFANAANNTIGGQVLLTNGSGLGPGDAADWGNADYFGLGVGESYWSGRSTTADTATMWASSADGNSCTNWSTTAGSSVVGMFDSSNEERWAYPAIQNCTGNRRLVCIIDP